MIDVSSVPEIKELNVQTDTELSNGEPSSEYAEYIRERNLSEASESQKLAKQLIVPKRPSPVTREAKDPRATSALLGEVKCRGEACKSKRLSFACIPSHGPFKAVSLYEVSLGPFRSLGLLWPFPLGALHVCA